MNDVIALTSHLIHTNGVTLTLDLDENLPWMSIDHNQMKQVLLNLVHNALQAMPNGGEMWSPQPPSCAMSVMAIVICTDTGVGITQLNQDRIFEPFFTTKGDRGGTGLGLSVTYGIVTDHGGQIDVESQPGKGSIFEVWLPLKQDTHHGINISPCC